MPSPLFTDARLDALRQACDPLADEAAAALLADPAQAPAWRKSLQEARGNRSPLPEGLPEAVRHFFRASPPPPWADARLLREGSRVFALHARDIMALLGAYSLPYCYCSALGVQVLHRSARMGYDTARRLAETGQFVFEAMDPLAFAPEGSGWRSVQQVRLLHASIRQHLMRAGWPSEWGAPINQEDLAGTLLSFSLIVLRGLRKMGHALQPREQEAYWHLWAVIGHGMGVADEVLPKDLREAFWLEKAIARRQFAPSDEGRALAQSLLDAFEQAEPAPLPKGVAANFMRQLLGPELADLLGLPPSQRPLDLLLALQRFRNAAAGLLRPSGTFDAAAALAEARSLSIPQAFAHQGFPFALQLGNTPPT